MPGRKEVRGGAGVMTLASNISSSSGTLQATGSVAGWPTGAAYPFVIKIDPQGAEEKCLCSSLAGASPATINIIQRGYDGTSQQAHNSGVPIQHCIDADSLDTMFDHIFNNTRDDHASYIRTDGTRGFTGLSAVAGSPVAVGTAQTPGSALTLARSDHVHGLGPLVVPTSALQDGAVTSAKIADGSIATADIGAGQITTPLILDAAVTNAKLAGGITGAKLAPGIITPDKMSPGAQVALVTVPLQNSGATSGTGVKTLGSGVIPAQSRPYVPWIWGQWQGINTTAGDQFLFGATLTDAASGEVGNSTIVRHAIANQSASYIVLPFPSTDVIPIGETPTLKGRIQRWVIGTGTISFDTDIQGGWVSALLVYQ